MGRNSGKTWLIEGLVRELTQRGFRVATVKHIYEGPFDTAQKDTWRHLRAGANPVIAVSSRELVTIHAAVDPSLARALQAVPQDVDVVLVEGFKEADQPKILVARSLNQVGALMEVATQAIAIAGPIAAEQDRPPAVQNIPILDVDALVSRVEELLRDAAVKRLPGIDCRRCGYESCEALAAAIVAGNASLAQCATLAERDVVLTVDGTPVVLSAFPKDFVRNTVMGMIHTLRGVPADPHAISLEIQVD
jgi:molybdopterin-guanine dinucleotide biosynthesis protein B